MRCQRFLRGVSPLSGDPEEDSKLTWLTFGVPDPQDQGSSCCHGSATSVSSSQLVAKTSFHVGILPTAGWVCFLNKPTQGTHYTTAKVVKPHTSQDDFESAQLRKKKDIEEPLLLFRCFVREKKILVEKQNQPQTAHSRRLSTTTQALLPPQPQTVSPQP